jgi:hypothetical protein
MTWKTTVEASEDWRKIELRPMITFKVEMENGKAEICFGLFGCYMNATPRPLVKNEPRFSATSEHERYLYIRGKGAVTVEEV